MAKNEVQLANYHCRFGDTKRLLDCALNIVIPAYTNDKLTRKIGETKLFFKDTVLLNVETNENPVLVLCGRFIKDTTLKREQIYTEERGLVKDRRKMQSSPSAIFMLILNNHRLVYFQETSYAPDLKSFESTSLNLIRKTHKNFIDKLHQQHKEINDKITKKSLYKTYPKPTLDVVPLSSKDSLRDFIKRFEILKTLHIKLVDPNDEIDIDDFFKGVREQKDRVGAKISTLTHSNISEGLNKENAIEDLDSIGSVGLHKLRFSGQDIHGSKLTGNNHDFQLTTPIQELEGDMREKAQKLHDVFTTTVQQDGIEIPAMTPETLEKLLNIMQAVNE